jgi:hypothetical protein
VTLLNSAGVTQIVGLPNLDRQANGLTFLFVRKPVAPCTGFETILITKFTGGSPACSGSLWANPSQAEAKDINALTQTGVAIGKKQYHFYQFTNLVVGNFYAMSFSMPIPAYPYYDNTIEYPTQYNCKLKLTAQTPPWSFSVIQATTDVESIGVNSPTASSYAVQTYLTSKETLTIGILSNTATIQPNQYAFYILPLTVPVGTTVQLFPVTQIGTPLMWITSPNDNPTTFDTTPPTVTQIAAGSVIPLNNPMDRFASILNPNQNAVTYKVMLSNGGVNPPVTTAAVTTGATPLPPAIVPTQNVLLALPLPAIIGIAVGIAAFIAIIIGSVFIYSKRKGKKEAEKAKADYKPVPQKKEKRRKENTPTSSSTESDSETSEEEEGVVEDDYDSYPPPRRGGGGRDRRGNSRRGGGGRDYGGGSNYRRAERSRERSYSDDDEDDYSSDDYS